MPMSAETPQTPSPLRKFRSVYRRTVSEGATVGKHSMRTSPEVDKTALTPPPKFGSNFGSNRNQWEALANKHTPGGIVPQTPMSPRRKSHSQRNGGKPLPQIVSPSSDIIAKKGFVGNIELLKGYTGTGAGNLDPSNRLKNFPSETSLSIVAKVLEKVKDISGTLPECVTFTLWATDNVNTYGKSMAQIFALVGARLSSSNSEDIELIPLDELKRPRIDVIVSCSGVYRDLFMNQMTLIDRVVKMAATADEPDDMNFVKKNATEQSESLSISIREAATRVFSNSAGSYSANISTWIKSGDWKDEQQLQKQFLERKGHAFNADRPGLMIFQGELFKEALKKCDVTMQNLDLSEMISITDVPHYYDSDPTKVVQGLRDDKKKPIGLVANSLMSGQEVHTLSELIRLDCLSKLLSPDYYDKVLKRSNGVKDISNCLRNLLGWAVSSGEVDTFFFEISNNVFLEDEQMQKKLKDTDNGSYQDIVTTFLKASEQGYWVTGESNRRRLRSILLAEWRSGSLASSQHGSNSGSQASLSGSRYGSLSSSRHGSSMSVSQHGGHSLSVSQHGGNGKPVSGRKQTTSGSRYGFFSRRRQRAVSSNSIMSKSVH